MYINSNQHGGIKIWEMGIQVTMSMKATTFFQVWHHYMLIIALIGEMMSMKVAYLYFINKARQTSCKNATYIMQYLFYTQTVKVYDHGVLKNKLLFHRHATSMILKPINY